MTNAEVAATFRRLADLLAIRGEDAYRVGAYRRAAASIGQTPESIAALRQLTERVPTIRHIALAGSLRRMRETIGDLDIAAAAEDPAAVVAAFAALPAVARVELRGPTRCRVVLHNGVPADLWVLPEQHW